MERLPLTIYIGPAEDCVLFENEIVAGLVEFALDVNVDTPTVRTSHTVLNCFPRPSGHRMQDKAKADRSFPLHIYAGDTAASILVSLHGRPLGRLRDIQVKLSTTQKRLVRITSYTPLPDEAEAALLDLGVEIIVEPPDTAPTAGGSDAHV